MRPSLQRAPAALVAVVVPARDEAAELPGCLAALAGATEEVIRHCPDSDVLTLIVLDGCCDASADVVARAGATALPRPRPGGVGVARAAGCDRVLAEARTRGLPASSVWLAMTDADCRVPQDWLTEQLKHRAAGARAVIGTVDVSDWTGRSDGARQRWERDYRPIDGHPHVHGANLGVDAGAYRAVGGFQPLRCHEDVALVAALERRYPVARPGLPRVLTSARREARVTGGFGDTLTYGYEETELRRPA